MRYSSEKERLLKTIRNSLIEKDGIIYPDIDITSEIYYRINDDPVMVFAENATDYGARFFYSKSIEDMQNKVVSLVDYRGWTNIYSTDKSLEVLLANKGLITNNHSEVELGIINLSRISSDSNIVFFKDFDHSLFSNLPPIVFFIANTSDIRPGLSMEEYDETDSLPTLNMIDSMNLLNEELKELYFFIIENMN